MGTSAFKVSNKEFSLRSRSGVDITEFDQHLISEGTHYQSYDLFGAHILENGDVRFAVWAPNASYVSVVGDFNFWNQTSSPMECQGGTGIWRTIVSGAQVGQCYKFYIENTNTSYVAEKSDPYAFFCEAGPRTASIIADLDLYSWNDSDWMKQRNAHSPYDNPVSIYELHLGSWKRDRGRPLSYLELADALPAYIEEMGFTHVEFLPVMEHPFGGSWGYQPLGYFAPTSVFGPPQDFMVLVDALHAQGIGVILDWVPAHFPSDPHGLAYFDGTHLYEHSDPKEALHPDWGTLIYNYGRFEVANFLISSALFWIEKYHIDALRVDAVASMLYRDYSKKEGEWIPNKYGGRENLEAVSFLKRFNEVVYSRHPDVMTIAEESTAWPKVSAPTSEGGLGFGFKWNMGWMNDTLEYFEKDPIYRSHHQGQLTFSFVYAFNENFLLPLSHDEVVHGKGSLIGKMPGDYWQKFANLRLLYSYMYFHPGKKLLFMGAELAQWDEWNHDAELDWSLGEFDAHRGISRLVQDLNKSYSSNPALYELDSSSEGLQLVNGSDSSQSVVTFIRASKHGKQKILGVFNFTPFVRHNYKVGVPVAGRWDEVFNSDSSIYWGSNVGNYGGVATEDSPSHGQPQSITLSLPPLAAIFLEVR